MDLKPRSPEDVPFPPLGRRVLLKPEIAPLEAYLAMRSVFGPPNSGPSEDKKVQWEWVLAAPDYVVRVYDYKLDSWSIEVYGPEESVEREANAFKKKVVATANKKVRGQLKNALKTPESLMIENPYGYYYTTATDLHQAAVRFLRGGDDSFSRTGLHVDSIMSAAFLMYFSAVEAFINLMYELYLRSDLRDDRIVTRLSREDLDVKLRLCPLHLDCFSGEVIDSSEAAIRDFQKLTMLRNDFVHGNVTKPMRIPSVVLDGFRFVHPSQDEVLGISRRFVDLTIKDIEKVKRVVDEVVDLVVVRMRPRDRRVLRLALDSPYIEIEFDDDGSPAVVEPADWSE